MSMCCSKPVSCNVLLINDMLYKSVVLYDASATSFRSGQESTKAGQVIFKNTCPTKQPDSKVNV